MIIGSSPIIIYQYQACEFDCPGTKARKAAIKYKVPYITTTAAAVKGVTAHQTGPSTKKSLQNYHSAIK